MIHHDAWVQAPPSRISATVDLADLIGLGALTLCPLMPGERGRLAARYTPSKLRGCSYEVSARGKRAGLMIWADADGDDMAILDGWASANWPSLISCGLFEVDAEEAYVRASKAARDAYDEALEALLARMSLAGFDGSISVTATQWDLDHGRLDALIARLWALCARHGLRFVLRPQWYVFRKPGQDRHWSHSLGEPEAQIGAWAATHRATVVRILDTLPESARSWPMATEPALAVYWQEGVRGHSTIPSAVFAQRRGAARFATDAALCFWSLNWIDGAGGQEAIVRATWRSILTGETLPPVLPMRPARTDVEEHHGDRERVRELQRQLAHAGYDPGAQDGRLGPRTRRALDRWTDDGLFAPDEWRGTYPQINALTGKLGLLEVAP